ncbi:MAG TPA: GNAT family N-acetyltransferase [Alphaproteobacteria bacterium]|nr:GNAT family N-acetyltransferase [Alphaproteobacteria bacterium]
MEPDAPDYSFRPARRDDLPLLRRWLRTPEVARWWGDPEEQAAMLAEDLDEPRMVMRIVCQAGRPFAYAQDYAVHLWPQPHLAGLPQGSRAIDTFIGEADMSGRGHGSAYLRLLAQRLLAEGAPAVAIDPDARNLRARRAFEKAGFRGDAVAATAEGPVVAMVFAG